MANVNSPFGLRPVKHLTGAEYNGQTNLYAVVTAANIIGIGDWVELTGSANSDGVPTVDRAESADTTVIGVVTAIVPDRENQGRVRIAAGESALVYVADAPDIIFEVQSDAGGVAAADVGLVATLTVADADATTGKSAIVLDANGANADARILRKKQIQDNDLGAYAVVEVVLVNHVYGSRSTTDI